MLKRVIPVFVCSIMLCCFLSAYSEKVSLPSDDVFETAKESLQLMSEKKLDQAIRTLNAGSWLDPVDLKREIESSCRQLYRTNVQQDYAVAWIYNGVLYMAVPTEDPSDGFVDTLLLSLNAQMEFASCSFVKWKEVENALSASSARRWCNEYAPSYNVFLD